LQTELEGTKSASSSDISALKESFEHQKSQFATTLAESEKKIQQEQQLTMAPPEYHNYG